MCTSSSSTTTTTTRSKAKTNENDIRLPFIGELFSSAYRAIPSQPLFLLVATAFFITLRIVITMILQSVFGWPGNYDNFQTLKAGEALVPVFNATLCCLGIIAAFVSHRYSPSEHLSKASPKWQDLVKGILNLCTGYMIYDFLGMLYVATPTGSYWPVFDTKLNMFLAHHTMTILYMSQAQYYQAGHSSAMMNMLLGELSNPLMNIHNLIRIASELECFKDSAILLQSQAIIPLVYSIVYIALRVFIGPIVCAAMTWDLLFSSQAKENLPLPLRILWSFMIWGVIFGSAGEILDCKDTLIAAFATGGGEQEL